MNLTHTSTYTIQCFLYVRFANPRDQRAPMIGDVDYDSRLSLPENSNLIMRSHLDHHVPKNFSVLMYFYKDDKVIVTLNEKTPLDKIAAHLPQTQVIFLVVNEKPVSGMKADTKHIGFEANSQVEFEVDFSDSANFKTITHVDQEKDSGDEG